MDKHGYTVKHQAKLLREKLEQLRTDILLKIAQTDNIISKLEDSTVDYGSLMYPTASDMLGMAQSVGLTNARLEALVWVEYNNQQEMPPLDITPERLEEDRLKQDPTHEHEFPDDGLVVCRKCGLSPYQIRALDNK